MPGFSEDRAADRAISLLEPPHGGGRVPRLQTALRQFGRDEGAELCEAAARQGSGERHIQKMSESGRRDPLTSADSEQMSGVSRCGMTYFL